MTLIDRRVSYAADVEERSEDSRRVSRAHVLLLSVLVTLGVVAAAVVATTVYPDGSGNLDEVAYLAQSDALEHGRLTLEAGEYVPTFRPYLSGVEGDRIVFKYQPVWPALMAISNRLVGSTLPLLTLLAAGGVVGMYAFVKELLGPRRPALIAGALMALSPFVWLQSGTVLTYHPTLVFVSFAGAALLRSTRTGSRPLAVIAGMLCALTFFHRPFDAVLLLGPIALYAGWSASRRDLLRALAWSAMGAVPVVITAVAYQTLVMGAPWRLAFASTGPLDRFGFGTRSSFVTEASAGPTIDYTIGRALRAMRDNLAVLPRLVFGGPLLVAAGIVTAVRNRGDPRVWLLLTLLVAVPVGYLSWWATANGVDYDLHLALGPMYHYGMLLPLLTLAVWGMSTLSLSGRQLLGLAVVAGLLTIPLAWLSLDTARNHGRDRSAEVALLTRTPADRSLVLQEPQFRGYPYVRLANDTNLENDHLVGLDRPTHRFELLDEFPDRAPYLVRREREFGDFLGPVHEHRYEIEIIDGPEIRFSVRAELPLSRMGRSYMRIGDVVALGDPAADEARDAFVLEVDDAPLGAFDVHVGVIIGDPSGAVPTSLDGLQGRYECVFRAQRSGVLRVMEPCEGRQHYAFPNGRTAAAAEDLAPVLDVEVTGS